MKTLFENHRVFYGFLAVYVFVLVPLDHFLDKKNTLGVLFFGGGGAIVALWLIWRAVHRARRVQP